jgi:hypothetical protein
LVEEHEEADTLGRRELAIREKFSFTSDHLIATCLVKFAGYVDDQEKLAKAEEFYRRGLATRQWILPRE